jgi:hypothetical protein
LEETNGQRLDTRTLQKAIRTDRERETVEDGHLGPKTPEGKRIASPNSYKQGMRSAEGRALEKLMLEMAGAEREARKRVQ